MRSRADYGRRTIPLRAIERAASDRRSNADYGRRRIKSNKQKFCEGPTGFEPVRFPRWINLSWVILPLNYSPLQAPFNARAQGATNTRAVCQMPKHTPDIRSQVMPAWR